MCFPPPLSGDSKMKRVSLNEIDFILRPPGLFVKNRRMTRSSKKTGKTDLSGYTEEVTDVIMGAIEITQNSCLRVLLEPQSMALILDKLPEDVLKEHREQKRNNGIIESPIAKKGLSVEEMRGAFTMILFVVSSYSSAMLLSLAQVAPQRIEKTALVVPSGVAHGPLMSILRSMAAPMLKYYFVQSDKSFKKIMKLMATEDDEQMEEFFKLMMSSYKMEMKPPREFSVVQISVYYLYTILLFRNMVFFLRFYQYPDICLKPLIDSP